MSRNTTYGADPRELPSCTIRPACTATTAALRALRRSARCGFRALAPVTAAPATVGAGAVESRATVPLLRVIACAAAFDAEAAGSTSHASCLPVTGGRPSKRPVSVEIASRGYAEISLARSNTELTYSAEWL